MEKVKIPVIDYTKCIHCDECTSFCKKNVVLKASKSACSKCVKYCISMDVPCNPDAYIFLYEQCDSCGDCVRLCSVKAIYWL